MLKIKDGVDLKELEKFGFTKEPMIYVKLIEKGNEGFLKFQKYIYIDEKSKTISIQEGMFNVDKELETIYDLITAGLVEKVEE
ncbi:MAG: hypothetical protein IJH39_01210 [Clostridia bacterium]|nr:hypothetical protein [Clostridia bacterium]